MKYELGDHSMVRCPETGLTADIEFKTKGWVSGKYDAVGGFIKDSHGKNLYEISGYWNGEMSLKNLTVSLSSGSPSCAGISLTEHQTGKKEFLFDAAHSRPTFPSVRPIEEQGELESQKLWRNTIQALKNKDHDAATDDKTRIEDKQREVAAHRGEQEWQPALFRRVQGGPGGPEEGIEELDWVLNAKM